MKTADEIKKSHEKIDVKTAEQLFRISFFAYMIIRFIVAIPMLNHWGINYYVFGILDIVTAFPYAIGVPKIVRYCRNREYPLVVNWSIILVISFLLPYLYIFYEGRKTIPVEVMIGFALLVVLLGVKAFFSIRAQVLRAE